MARQSQFFFLEEWLRSTTLISNNKIGSVRSSATPAQEIIKAWADLREPLRHQSFNAHHLQGLKILVNSQASLHVADPQAKILTSILSSQSLSLPQESYPLFLRLLYIWVRKSRQTPLVADSAVNILLDLFSRQSHCDKSSLFFSEGILLFGALSFQSSASEKHKGLCLELLCKLLEEEYKSIFLSDELASNALAGIGYALSSPVSIYFRRILDVLLSIWGNECCPSPSGRISQGLMFLHMTEWAMSNSLNSRFLDKIDLIKGILENVKPTHSSFAAVMVSAGVLRATNRSGSSGFLDLKNYAEERIEIVAKDLISRTKGFEYHRNHTGYNYLMQCISLALARSGSISYRPFVLMSLALSLSTEVFPLQRIYNKILKFPEKNWTPVLDEIKHHLGCVIFKEAGSITGAFCNQYASADEDNQNIVENLVWDFCHKVYLLHRQATMMLVGRGDELIKEIEKIAESSFLMVVVFALGVTKHRLDTRRNRETQLQISVRILVSFSCMEYFRRMRLPEYMDTVRAVIGSVQENESACISFVESMPSYDDLTNNRGSFNLPKLEYIWSTDEVQTARIVFYMRVIPTCVERLPASVFKRVVAPTMFLYIGHPNGKVARCSHTVFVAFISSGKDANHDERILLKEQLFFYYLQRSLEGYPAITPFEGMASGVAALVRYLPAGSPSIFYCIHSLVEKATSLCSTFRCHDSDLWNNWDEELEPAKKIVDLLVRLLSLVDIQVLPNLMKLLAQLIVQIPVNGQNMLLNQLYEQIAESDDVIRKPALISWLQSLSYLCSQGPRKKEPELTVETASAKAMGSINLYRVNARL